MAIDTTCPHCAAPYRLADSSLGMVVRCKHCTETFTAARSAPPPLPKGPPPVPVQSIRDVLEDEEEDSEAARPASRRRAAPRRRSRGGSGVIGWLMLIGFLLLLIAGAGVGVWFFFLRPTKPTEERFNKLVLDMKESELLSILGPPSRTERAAGNATLEISSIDGSRGRVRAPINRIHFWEFGDVEVRAGVGTNDTVVYATGKFGGKVRWVSEDMDTRRFKELKVDKLFDEVAVGMTMDEVVRKIGEPKMTSVLRPDRYKDFGIKEEDVKRPDGSLKEVRELTYNAPDGALSVYVIDGKVYRKNRIRR